MIHIQMKAHGHTYVLRFDLEDREGPFLAIAAWVNDPRFRFDWFDGNRMYYLVSQEVARSSSN